MADVIGNNKVSKRKERNKTTVIIKSNTNNVQHGNQGNNQTTSPPTNHRTRLYLSTKKLINKEHGDEIAKDKSSCKDLSFDSGYFGGTATTNHLENNDVIRKIPTEVHAVKYRCIPVYQPEIVRTGMIHEKVTSTKSATMGTPKRSETSRPVESEEALLHKKWASQTIEPTQEPVDFLPRSAEFISNIKEKFRQERERKIDQLKKESQKNSLTITTNDRTSDGVKNREYKHTRSRSSDIQELQNFPGKEFKRSHSCKQYPIERATVGSQSSKVNRRASYNVHNTSRSSPRNQSSASTVYDSRMEQGKVAAFASALENAGWHKKPLIASNW